MHQKHQALAAKKHPGIKLLSWAMMLTLSGSVLAGCGAAGEEPETAASATRIVTDATGEVEVPSDPQRVVSTDFYSSSLLVDVGIVPVGTMQGVTEPESRPQKYIDALQDAAEISTYAEIDVEKILELDPDLIIVDSEFSDPETVKRLEEIAPSFKVDVNGDWDDRALSVADAVNKLDTAKQQQAAFEQRAAQISQDYRDVLEQNPLGILSLNPNEATWAGYTPTGWASPAWVAVDAQFREPTDGEAKEHDQWAWISDELLEKLDNAGILLVLEDEQLERYKNNPLWNSLPAVKAGNVFAWNDSPATSSFEWGMYNLDSVENILKQVKN